MSRVLITPRSFTSGALHPELARLQLAGHELVLSPSGRLPTPEELHSLVPSCHAWLAGIETIDRAILEAAINLRIIARHGVGLDSIDLDAADAAGIAVVPSSGSNAEGVAELVIFHALAARRPHRTHLTIDDPEAWKRQLGTELQHRHAAVIGYGAIGSRVAHLLEAFEMRVRVFDPFATPPPCHHPMDSVIDAVANADLVTLHCPPSTAPIIGAPELAVFSSGATLINTARGSLVDSDAILNALESGQLGAFACDVFTTEPPDPHPLWLHPNVRATPHIGGFTLESGQRSAALAVDAILEVLR